MTMPLSADDLIELLRLEPHPEGGYFRETYRARGSFGDRRYSTAIYFLLPARHVSRLHRLKSDETWFFHKGGPLTIVEITPEGQLMNTVLGPELDRNQVLQHVVPAGTWFGAYPAPGTVYTLVSCTVSPGFEFSDFELADRAQLLAAFPRLRREIELLT